MPIPTEPGWEPAVDAVLAIFDSGDARDDILAHLTLGEVEAVAYLAYYRGRSQWPKAQQIMLSWAENDEDVVGDDEFYADALARWGLAWGAIDSDEDHWYITSTHINLEG